MLCNVWKLIPSGSASYLDKNVGTAKTINVNVQGRMRKYKDYWVVTLFLVNGQEEPKQLRDTAWLFQPELVVEAPDESPIFVRRLAPRSKGKADTVLFAEEQSLDMLYRRQVEFAVGHGVSVRVFPVAGRGRAVPECRPVAPSCASSKASGSPLQASVTGGM